MAVYNDFLSLSMAMVRRSIRGIDDSYSNYWDILAELLQNSVDAIKKTDRVGRIEIGINYPAKSITVKDNGCGIVPSELPTLLKPFCTNKDLDPITVGEKGVGLKYAYFQSLKFEIKTGTSENGIYARIENARLWKQQTTEDPLQLYTEDIEGAIVGTEISLEGIENEDLFSLTKEQLVYILRTKTAVGNTDSIWGPTRNIDITLHLTDDSGNVSVIPIPYKYFLPTEVFSPASSISFDDYISWLNEMDRSDQKKREKLRDKIITKQIIDTTRPGRPIKAWACFVPKRDVWGKISKAAGLISETEYNDYYSQSEWKRERADKLFTDGIYTAVKGMPTTIKIEPPTTGYAGYWPNMFIIFQDDKLSFDIGRKYIHGHTSNIYRNIAAQLFKDITGIAIKYISGSPEVVITSFSREEVLQEINALPNLGVSAESGVKFVKNPYDQEASVCAIFYELIGAGKISDITPLISGYKNRYDLYAKWNNKTISVEFKSRLRFILKDFDNAIKMFDEVDYIVCWGITDDDINELYGKGIDVTQITDIESDFTSSANHLSCTTHVLTMANVNPIYVIDLKKFLGL